MQCPNSLTLLAEGIISRLRWTRPLRQDRADVSKPQPATPGAAALQFWAATSASSLQFHGLLSAQCWPAACSHLPGPAGLAYAISVEVRRPLTWASTQAPGAPSVLSPPPGMLATASLPLQTQTPRTICQVSQSRF